MTRAFLTVWLTPVLFAQTDPQVRIDRLSSGYGFASALHMARDGYLLITDTVKSSVTKISADGPSVFRKDIRAAGVAAGAEGRVYLSDLQSRTIRRINKNGQTETVATGWQDKRFNGPSDLALTKNGTLWFVDPAFGSAEKDRQVPHYGIYRLTSKGELALAGTVSGRPNGIAFSPDEKTLYVTDADRRLILAWTVDRAGILVNERAVVRDTPGVPDGLTTASNGNLYVAAGAILVYSPDGKLLDRINVPERATDCEFSDAAGHTLYVTARTSVYRVRLGEDGEEKHK